MSHNYLPQSLSFDRILHFWILLDLMQKSSDAPCNEHIKRGRTFGIGRARPIDGIIWGSIRRFEFFYVYAGRIQCTVDRKVDIEDKNFPTEDNGPFTFAREAFCEGLHPYGGAPCLESRHSPVHEGGSIEWYVFA